MKPIGRPSGSTEIADGTLYVPPVAVVLMSLSRSHNYPMRDTLVMNVHRWTDACICSDGDTLHTHLSCGIPRPDRTGQGRAAYRLAGRFVAHGHGTHCSQVVLVWPTPSMRRQAGRHIREAFLSLQISSRVVCVRLVSAHTPVENDRLIIPPTRMSTARYCRLQTIACSSSAHIETHCATLHMFAPPEQNPLSSGARREQSRVICVRIALYRRKSRCTIGVSV